VCVCACACACACVCVCVCVGARESEGVNCSERGYGTGSAGTSPAPHHAHTRTPPPKLSKANRRALLRLPPTHTDRERGDEQLLAANRLQGECPGAASRPLWWWGGLGGMGQGVWCVGRSMGRGCSPVCGVQHGVWLFPGLWGAA